jgi:hypothetical protein
MSPAISFIQGDDVTIGVNVTVKFLATRTANSTTLVGSGTAWTSAMVNCVITFTDNTTATVASVQSTTSLTLTSAPTVSDAQPLTTVSTVNITGWTLWFTIKKTLPTSLPTMTDVGTALIQSTQSTHINAAQGVSSISLPRATTNIPQGQFFYDIRSVDSNGLVKSAKYGQCIIYPASTQSVS